MGGFAARRIGDQGTGDQAVKEITSFALSITPIRAWTHIADLAAFAVWHPSYRFRGNAAPGARVGLTFGLLRGELPIKAGAKIIAYERAHCLAWRTGLGGVLTLHEEYALDGLGEQTRVRHSITMRGMLSPLGYTVRRGLRSAMRAQDAALVRYLTKEARGSGFTVNRRRRRVRKAQLSAKGRS